MVTAEFYEDQNHDIAAYRIYGHAGHGRYGHDIVCAAVSALSISITNAIESKTKASCEVVSEEGYLFCRLNKPDGSKTRLLTQTLKDGLISIFRSYGGDYIQIQVYSADHLRET